MAPDHRPVAAVLAVMRRPALWSTALRQLRRMAGPRWWTRAPHLPVPAPGYLHFRMVTAYGGDGEPRLAPDDVVAYLDWCREWG